jgi:hypothetical protein
MSGFGFFINFIFDKFLWFRKFGNIFQMFSKKNRNLLWKSGKKKNPKFFLVTRVPTTSKGPREGEMV